MPDIRLPVAEANELVKRELMTESDFRSFIFKNTAELHVQMNPDFYKGTAVEGNVQKLIDSGEILLPDHTAALNGVVADC